jgi:hypothetical protein
MRHSRHLRQAIAAAALVFGAVALLGCGKGGARYAVEGTATLNGSPVDGGKILFLPTDEDSVKAFGEIVGGKFALDTTNGPNAGKYKVEIVWYKKTGKKVMNDGKEVDETQQVVPGHYNVTSTTFIEVKPEKNTCAFDMKGAAPTKSGTTKRNDNN